MEKRNPMLKKAFEEAAKKELAALPEERFVIRACSPEFENKIQNIIDCNTEKKGYCGSAKSRKLRWSVLVAAALMCVLVIGVSAGEFIQTFSAEWRGRLSQNITNAEIGVGVEEFDAEHKISEDPFAVASREAGTGKYILPDYNQSIEYNGVVAEDEGYRFELKSVTKAKKKHRVIASGSISDATAEYEWKVSDSYFAIIEIKRSAGGMLTDEDKDAVSRMKWSCLIMGYSPSMTSIAFRGNTVIRYDDEYGIYYAVEITEMMPFAGNTFGLTLFEADREPDTYTVRADEKGNMELKNEDEFFGVLLKFSVDVSFADESYASCYFADKGLSQPARWFERYYD